MREAKQLSHKAHKELELGGNQTLTDHIRAPVPQTGRGEGSDDAGGMR